MQVSTHLDYNNLLKIIMEMTEEEISYDFECDSSDKHLSKIIMDNLKGMSHIEATDDPDIYRLSFNDTLFFDVSRSTGEVVSSSKLTTFETRSLAQSKTGVIPFERDKQTDFLPRTDLHTHFAGAIRPEDLIAVGISHNIDYPASSLKMIGIDVSAYEVDDKGNLKIATLLPEDLKILESKMMISVVTQETFNKMEEIYALRGPFTKNPELFPDYLRALAEDYSRNGVEYAELSFSAFMTNPSYMQMLEDNLPQIEEETGVKLRFLAGIWRHSDIEWNMDDADRIMQVAQSPYIVGCDVMGHETNSTDEIKDVLETLARYAMEEDPDFVIRVHAGENPMFKDNVRRALEIMRDAHEQQEQTTGTNKPMPRVRIGHGLYGVEEEVINLAKEMGAIIEFNMSSNLALNNINSIAEVPIKKYIDQGIDVVLGTDGHGMYSTSGEQEVLLAMAAGLEPEDFELLRATEQKVLERALAREQTHPRIENVAELYEGMSYSTPTGEARYTPDVEARYRAERENASARLGEKISYTGAIVDEAQIEADTEGKVPVMITGASKSNWPNILPADQEKIALTMQVLADVIDPERAYIVTGGTNFGVEKTMHEAVNRRNKIKETQLVLLGTLTMEAAKEGDKGVEPDTITHATILELNGRKANNWMDLPDTQLEYVLERNGHMIAIGGGGVVNDMIQRGHNLGVNMHLMKGPYGASTNKSIALEGNNYSFVEVSDLLERLYEADPQIFIEGFDLEKVEQYITQARDSIAGRSQMNPANFGLGSIGMIDATISDQDRMYGLTQLEAGLAKPIQKTVDVDKKKSIGGERE